MIENIFQRSIPYLLATYLLFFGSTSCERTSKWDQCGCFWEDWEAWGTCDSECNGRHSRSREVWLYAHRPGCTLSYYTCETDSASAWDYSRCNSFCYNGGTSDSYSCRCVTGFYGECCGHRKNLSTFICNKYKNVKFSFTTCLKRKIEKY